MPGVPCLPRPGEGAQGILHLSKRDNFRSGQRMQYNLPLEKLNPSYYLQDKFVCDWWFNVDCESSQSFFGAVEGAFGGQGSAGGQPGGGQCPAPGPGLECAGALDMCWSPGQNDIDCPNSGLCW